MVSASKTGLSTFFNGASSRCTPYNRSAQKVVRPVSQRNFRPLVCVPNPIMETFLIPNINKRLNASNEEEHSRVDHQQPLGRALCEVYATCFQCRSLVRWWFYFGALRRTLRVLTRFSFFLMDPPILKTTCCISDLEKKFALVFKSKFAHHHAF